MKLSLNNFLYGVKQIVTGGGAVGASGEVPNDSGFLVDGTSIYPGATAAAGTTALTVVSFAVPRDYDEETDVFSLSFSGRSAGATDTPSITLTAVRTRAGVADATVVSGVNLGSMSTALQTFTQDVNTQGLKRGDVINVALVAAAHATDAIERIAVTPAYRSCLVSYHEETTAGVALR